MPSLAIHTGRALTPLAEIPDALILLEDGRIRAWRDYFDPAELTRTA